MTAQPAAAVAAKGFCLKKLKSETSVFLNPGVPSEQISGLMLTLNAAEQQVLVEVIGDLELTINHELVYDLAPMRPGDTLRLAGDEYIFMQPAQTLIAPDRTLEDKLAVLEENQADFVLRRLRRNQRIRADQTQVNPRKKKIWVVTMAICATFFLVGIVSALSEVPNKPENADKETVHLTPIGQKPEIDQQQDPTEVLHDPPAPKKIQKFSQAKDEKVAPRLKKPSTKAASVLDKVEEKRTYPKISKESLQRQAEYFKELQLEAKFNPEGVLLKLEHLEGKVPAAYPLGQKIRSFRKALSE